MTNSFFFDFRGGAASSVSSGTSGVAGAAIDTFLCFKIRFVCLSLSKAAGAFDAGKRGGKGTHIHFSASLRS
jgi:hypothetical protein